jgi:hypothetical protein
MVLSIAVALVSLRKIVLSPQIEILFGQALIAYSFSVKMLEFGPEDNELQSVSEVLVQHFPPVAGLVPDTSLKVP